MVVKLQHGSSSGLPPNIKFMVGYVICIMTAVVALSTSPTCICVQTWHDVAHGNHLWFVLLDYSQTADKSDSRLRLDIARYER